MKSFISYNGLPISSGGAHQISSRTMIENYDMTIEFLNKFGNTRIPEEITLSLYHSVDKEYSIVKPLFDLIRHFGLPRYSYDGLLKSWNWQLKPKSIPKALEAIERYNYLPDNYAGPITLGIIWFVSFKDLSTGKALKNQGIIPTIDFRLHNSQLYLRLGKKSTISAWFTFPFEELGDYELNYLNQLNKALPFKPSDLHWRMWTKSKNNNWTPKKIKITTANNAEHP